MNPFLALRTVNWSKAGFWAGLGCVAGCHLISLERIPLPWLDEVHIVEMGRNILESNNLTHSLLTSKDGSFFQPIYYLGPVLQEFAYRAFGHIGPRLSALVALLMSTLLCRIWLRQIRTQEVLVTPLSLAFLTYPLLIQSVKLVRVDAWAFVPFFLCLLLLERLSNRPKANTLLMVAIGALAVASFFLWPSATLFYPFFIFVFLSKGKTNGFTLPQVLVYSGFAAAGGFATGVALLLPVRDIIIPLIQSIGSYFAACQPDAGESVTILPKLRDLLLLLIKESLRSPFFMLLFFIGMLSRHKDWLLFSCFLLSLGMGIQSGLHTFRFIFLLPFLFLFAQAGASSLYQMNYRWAHALLACVVFYGVFTGAIAYALATPALKGRSYAALKSDFCKAIGAGPKHVYLNNLQSYYFARELRWHYRRYGQGSWLSDDVKQARLLEKVDFIVDSEQPAFYAIEESFTLYGLVRDYLIRSARREENETHPSRLARIGQTLAFRAPNAQELRSCENQFAAAGFSTCIRLNAPRLNSDYPHWQKMIRSYMAVNPDYDTSVVWSRSQTSQR